MIRKRGRRFSEKIMLKQKNHSDNSRRMAGLAGRIDVDVAALEQIVEASDAIPAVAIALDHQPVPAALVGMTVILRQEVDQQLACVSREPGRKRNLPRLLIE